MSVVRIDTAADPRVADFTNLTDVALRRVREPAEGLFMAESLEVIRRATTAGYRIRSVLSEERWLGQVARIQHPPPEDAHSPGPVPGGQPGRPEPAAGSTSTTTASAADFPVYVAEPEVLRSITGYRLHRGLLAAMQRRPLPEPDEVLRGSRNVVVLHGLVDHTNVGAAFRSAAAMGMDAVLVSGDCADPLYRRSVRVSMGTVFQIPWARLPDGPLRQVLPGFTTIALTPDGDAVDLPLLLSGVSDPVALLVGSEGPGLPDPVLAQANHRARIPMTGAVDSLNVAAAVAVASFLANSGRPVAVRHRQPGPAGE